VNARPSRVRARAEHVFAFQESALGGESVHTIGIARAFPRSNSREAIRNNSIHFHKVVFTDEQHGQFMKRNEIKTFVKYPFLGGTVTEKNDSNLFGPVWFGREG